MLTQKEFIEKARKVHGDKYDYSKVIYSGERKKLLLFAQFMVNLSKNVEAI